MLIYEFVWAFDDSCKEPKFVGGNHVPAVWLLLKEKKLNLTLKHFSMERNTLSAVTWIFDVSVMTPGLGLQFGY